MDYSSELAKKLLEIEAVKLRPGEPFTWTSGLKSPIYCDNRMLVSHPEAVRLVVSAFMDIIKRENLKFDYVSGTATAGIPWAAFLAYELKLPMIYVRPKPKEHGAGKQIEGDLRSGAHALVVEDLVSTGGSSCKTVEVLRREGGATVTDVLAIFSYNFKESAKLFIESKVGLHTISDVEELTKVAVDMQYITVKEREMVIAFTRDPKGWQS